MEEGAGPRQEISKGPTFAQEVGKSRLPHTGHFGGSKQGNLVFMHMKN